MSKEVKVVYENFRLKYKVVPAELIVEKDKIHQIYNGVSEKLNITEQRKEQKI